MENEQHNTRNLQQQWERAVKHAATPPNKEDEFDAERLNEASGMNVQSGIRGSLWTYSQACTHPAGIC